MNQSYRLVFSRVRNMLVAVEETATAAGKRGSGEASIAAGAATAMVLAGFALGAHAQIAPGGANAPSVIQTQNGMDQVNINRPSGAGVSVNTYNRFDVQQRGAILNNSPTIVQTQQAGMINGNPNFAPGQSARIIVNQVNGPGPSQLNGHLEVAGSRAEVVIANPSGIAVNGGGFINTSRAILTTGTPNYAGDGSLAGFNVSGGNITISGAGLNASNVDQVDLLSRAVQANAAIYAKNLNVVTGANRVDHDTLAATPIAGDGPAQGVSIDVSQLGGMYANRIVLVGTELGVGVSTRGVLAAQAGDLVLTSAGKLELAGQTSASGNISASAQGGIDNSGTTYAQQGLSASTAGALANRGTLAAQQNVAVNAGSVASSGTLASGVNGDGVVTQAAALNVSTTGTLTATGHNVAGGDATFSGASVNLAGSETAANGNLSLSANAGDLNLSGATTSAHGAINAQVAGALLNDHGTVTGGAVTLNAGRLSNQGGKISAQAALNAVAARDLSNQGGQFVSQGAMQVRGGPIANNQGTMQSAAGFSLFGTSLDNTAGRIVLLNGDGLSLGVSGALLNGPNGVIGGNGNVRASAYTFTNAGQLTAQTDLSVSAHSLDNRGGSLAASGNAVVDAGSQLLNSGGVIEAGYAATVSATSLDNSSGTTQAAQLSLNATNLVNHAGTITQTGNGAMNVAVSGTLDNSSGGTLQTNSADLTLSPATLNNDGGTITHAGTGTLTINAGGGSGSISNARGTITGNGKVVARAGSFDNASGAVIAQSGIAATVGGALNNANGKLLSNTDLSIASGALANDGGQLGAGSSITIHSGSMTNKSGSIVAPNVAITTDATLDNSGGDIEANQLALRTANLVNHGGAITQYGAALMGIDVSGIFDNSAGGTLQTNSTDLTLAPATFVNDHGTITHAGNGTLTINARNGAGSISNAGGTIASNGKIVAQGGAFDNAAGSVVGQNGLAATVGGTLNNANGKLLSNTDLSVASGSLTNDGGQLGAGANATIHSGSMTNSGGSIVAPNLAITTDATLDNSGGDIEANQLALNAANLVNHGGTITQYGAALMGINVSGTFDNSAGGTLQTNGADFTLAAGALNNNGGTILDAGAGTFTLAAGKGNGAFSNVGGRVITAGQFVTQAGSLDNTSGVLAAQGGIAATIAGDLNNTQGVVRALSSASLASGGTLTNTHGQIQSGTGEAGDASTLAVRAARIDNAGGLVGNLGAGDTTVQGGSQIINSGGQITGNGNVGVNASSISNTDGGQISGANVATRSDTLDNTNGAIGNVAGLNGDVTVTNTGAIDNTHGQIGATHDLAVSASTLTGGGAYSAANDVAINLQGDFAPTPEVQFNAGHDLTFALPGTFTNAALLEAANNLGIHAGNIVNSGTMMAGGTLGTHSNTLENTGVIVGGSVSLNATQTLSNLGPTALIGATDSEGTLELLANDIENRDDTTATDTQAGTAIYGLGKVVLAGGKDASGNYMRAGLIRNQSGLIESAGDMELHADEVTNTRRVVTTTGFNQAVDPALLEQLGISMSGCTAIYMEACAGQNVGWTKQGDPNLIGGVYIEPPHAGQWNSGYQYTTYTGVAVANLIAGISPQAQIVAGGSLDTTNVGVLQNYWSAVASAGDIAAPVMLDQNSWRGQAAPGVQVTYSGYYHYNNYDNTEHDWTLPFGDAPFVGKRPGGYTQAAPADIRNYALPSYESSFVAGGTLSGTGISIDNTAGNAGIPSLGLAAGQALSGVEIGALSGNASGANTGAASLVSGNAGGTKSGATRVEGGAAMVNPVIASATAVNVLSNLTIPQGGLFRPVSAPGAGYLIETNPAFTNQKSFISSDYYLQQLGLNPQTTQKRLGDGFYEQQLVRNQVTSLTGRAVLGPYTDLQAMYESLLAAGASLSKSLDLPIGIGLSPEQVAALTSNVIIMQTQIVNGQPVLVPVVYLAKASQQNMSGPLIAATDIDLRNAQTFTNSGTVQAGNSMKIDGQSINNAFGALQSGGLMSLTTAGNVDLTSSKVNAGSLALNAGGKVVLDTASKTLNQISPTGATRVTTTLGPLASLNVAGDAAIVTGGNFEQHGAALNVGGNLGMSVGGDYNLGTVQTGEHKVVERANGISNTDINQATGSSVNVGGVSMIGVGGDLTARGADIKLGGGGAIAAKGNVTLDAAKATSIVDSNSSGSDSHGSYSESMHRSDETLTGTTLNAGNSLAVVSGKDINVTGSTITLDKGTATLAATGNVNIGAATETHVDNSQSASSHSGVASHKSMVDQVNQSATYADGSTISADSVLVISAKDINVTGSNIVGTHDVALAAKGNVNITAATDTLQESEYHQVKESGLSGSGGLGVTIGSSEQSARHNGTSVTQSQSRSTVGSVEGNVGISAGKDVRIGGSDIVAGKAAGDVTGATGNITIAGQNVTIDPGQDARQSHDQQEAHSSGVTIGVTGTPFDTARNLKADASSGNGFQRTQSGLTEIGASAADTPSISVSYGRSQRSSTTDMSSMTNSGSAIRGGGNVSIAATGGAARDAAGQPLDGDLSVIGSTIGAGGTTSLVANRSVTLQASTDQFQQGSQSGSSSTGISLATPGLGDMARWIGGTANTGGTSPSPYNASSSRANGDQTASTQTATVVSGNSVVVKSRTGDINVVGSGISGTQGVDLVASQGAVNVLAGVDTQTNHQESDSHQIGNLGSNGTATGFSVGVANSHGVTDSSARTQSTMRSQIVSGKGNVTLDAMQDVTVQGADISAGKNLTLIGKNLNLDPGTDGAQSSMSQSSSQFGVSLALGGAVGNAIATVNQSMNQASTTSNSRLAALDTAQAGLAAYNAWQVASAASTGPTAQPLIKANVSIGGGTSQSRSQENSLANDGSTLHAGGDVTLVATGSGTKDAGGFAADGNISAVGTQISGQNVTLNAARDINLQSARDTSQQSGSNNSSGGSIGIGAALGGQQNGFTLELAASASHGNMNGQSVTNHDTQIAAGNTLSMTSGRDTNLRGAEVAGNTVNASVGRDLNIQSQQDTSTYDSKQSSAGAQLSLCVPPFCYGQTVSGSGSASQQNIKADYQSVNQQSGIHAGNGGFDINVANHTQLDGGVIASTADTNRNSLSTQTLGFTNLENHASYSGDTMGFSMSGGLGKSTPGGVNLNTPVMPTASSLPGLNNSAGLGATGVSIAGTSSDASGTTYAAVSPGAITVRGDAGTGQDSTAGLSRDTGNAHGAVRNTFDAQSVQDDMEIQQKAGQAGMQAVGNIAAHMETQAQADQKQAYDAYQAARAAGDQAGMAQAQADYNSATQQLGLWGNDGAARIASHAAVAALGAGLGGGSAPGAVAGTVAGDVAANATSNAVGDSLGGTLLSNAAAGVAGAAAGGVAGGSAGAMSGAGGALSADLYNRQLHEDSKAKEQTLAQKLADESGGKYSVQDVENQMALMNLTVNGQTESGGVRVATGAQPQDGTDWQAYGVNQAGQQVWAQNLGAGDPDLQAYIAKGAQGSGLSYQATTTGSNPGLIRAPDFVNFQIDYFVGSAWGTFTRDGNSFFGYGVNLGIPNAVGAGVNVSAGYLNTTSVRPGQTNNFAGGYAGGGSALYGGLGGGIMVSPGNGTATVIGFGAGTNVGKTDNPASVGWGFSNDQGKTGIKW